MVLRLRSFPLRWLVLSIALISFAPSLVLAKEDDRKAQELQKKLEELRAKKSSLEQQVSKKSEQSSLSSESLAEVIAKYEKIYADCQTKKSERCADVMFSLAKYYYDDAQDGYIKSTEVYEQAMDVWEKGGSKGTRPIRPLPNFSKSITMYRKVIADYPSFIRADEAMYQVGAIMLRAGELDSAKLAFTYIVDKTPNSKRVSAAHFQLADFSYSDREWNITLDHLIKIQKNLVTIEVWEQVVYRKAEMYYNLAQFDKAAELFNEYVERCDAGEYVKKQFRDMALEFMAVSFSDIPQGATEAIKFFKKLGGRPYEATVIYMIGRKNRVHGQFDDAIVALQTALKNYPYYKDAPIAQFMLVECMIVKKKLEEANIEREKLIDFYQEGSEWFSRNKAEKAVIDQSHEYVKTALANICTYNHAIAVKKKDRALFEKALKRYNEFFQRFPEDKWKVYEFKFYVGDIFTELQQFDNAVAAYWFVATEDISKYPEYKVDVDSLMFDDAKQFEEAKQRAQKGGAMSVSQEDAGYNAIICLDNARKKRISKESLNDEKGYLLPETQKMVEYVGLYQKRFPKNENSPELLYIVGNILYSAKVYDKAISQFKYITENYSSATVSIKAYRMLAKTYSASGEHDLASVEYKKLLERTDANSKEYAEIVDLATAALFSKAEALKKASNYAGAAELFKSVLASFPTSTIADRGWFEAGVCYEEAKNLELAAQTFEELAVKFPKSTVREQSYKRAGDNYKTLEKWDKAAETYAKGAVNINKADYSIPSLSAASECYQKTNNFEKAAQMFEIAFNQFPTDARSPQALYNAGLIYENKAKMYDRAQKAYAQVAEKFPTSEYAEDASFSVGLCLEKLNAYADAAVAFSDFAKKFASKGKQAEALVKAGSCYMKAGAPKDAETSFLSATALYEKFNKKGEYNLETIARAYFELGEMSRAKFKAIALTGANEKAIKEKEKEKTKALEPTLTAYSKAIALGVPSYVFRTTFKIAQCFVDFADALANQTFFGSRDQKMAGKLMTISQLDKYYVKAQEKYGWNIDKAYDQGITDPYVDSSSILFMKMAYLQGHLFEEFGELVANAAIPSGLTKEEETAYKELLEEKKLEAMDKALPKYENGIRAALELGIVNVPWTDSIRARIAEINPSSEWAQKTIVARPANPNAKPSTPPVGQGEGGSSAKQSDSNGSIGISDKPLNNSGSDSKSDSKDGKKKKGFLFWK